MDRPSDTLADDHAVFQTSTISTLMAGNYDGTLTVDELLQHGDFGLGTFNHLDGEMVVLDGVCHHLRAEGTAQQADPSDLTPFAAVARFEAQQQFDIDRTTDLHALIESIETAIGTPDTTVAVKVTGRFSKVSTRTVAEQHRPYPPLVEAAAGQVVRVVEDVHGTLVGFRTPRFEESISVAGYHLHFIDEDQARGGHALDFVLEQGQVELCTLTTLHLNIPDVDAYLAAAADGTDRSEMVQKVEGGTASSQRPS